MAVLGYLPKLKKDLGLAFARFPKWDRLVGQGGQFGQNGQKLHENDKFGILGSKQWGGTWGGQPNVSGSGGDPPSVPPPH